ncbi:MAG: hypothetical protein K2H09_07535 [Treponemataceae bacterium]|nr:hypothetical protein [Treponemataceae bacterium]
MKRTICILLIAAAFVCTVAAVPTERNEKNEENWTDLMYVNVPILKILDSRDGYVVLYSKNKTGVGKTVIPKKWIYGKPDEPRKLKINNLPKGKMQPYMTVISKGGEFKRVVLTIPPSKNNALWGVVGRGVAVDTDKDTLEPLEL